MGNDQPRVDQEALEELLEILSDRGYEITKEQAEADLRYYGYGVDAVGTAIELLQGR